MFPLHVSSPVRIASGKTLFRWLVPGALICVLASLTSCGGSGGGTVTQPPPPDFTMTVTTSAPVIVPGGSLPILISITPQNGFTGSVSVTLTGVPTGATVTPASPITLTSDSQTVTIQTPASAALGTYTISVQATSGSLQQTATVGFQIELLAGFSLSLNNSELSMAQGGSALTLVGLSETSDGDADYNVEFTVSGLPSGVQATFGTNPLAMGQAATAFTLTASANAGLANHATVTVIGTRSIDGDQQSATFTLNVTPPVGSLPDVRTDFVRTDGTPSAAVFDPVHNVVYASNPQWNRVDVISPSTHQIVKSVSAPSPTGMDLSLDGTRLIVAGNSQQIVSIDTNQLQVVQRTSVPPIVQGGASYSIPGLIANTSNGTALVGMTLDSLPPSYYLEQWNPANGTFTALSAPGVSFFINQLVRTGDGEEVLVVDYGTDTNLAVYDAATSSFSVSGQSPVGQVLGAVGNPKSHQFAIVGTNGLALVDTNLTTQATSPIGGAFYGMAYSADGTKLYAAMNLVNGQCGPFYPVILTFDTTNASLIGAAPAFEEGYAQDCTDTYSQASPLTADGNGMVYSAYSHGLVMDDAANIQNLLNLPEGPPFPGLGFNDEAELNQTLATSLGNIAYDVLPSVWFGSAPGTGIDATGGLVSVTAPASATPGLINVKAVEPDGWFALTPQSFSYSSQVLFPGGNAGSTQGGATLALVGYGLVGNNGSPAVTIGGQSAAVKAATKYIDISDSTVNQSYPFPDMDEVVLTVPPGTAGPADVVVTSGAGTATLSKAFSFLPVTDYSSADSFTYILYDPQRHWVYLSAGNHIDVFSADTQLFLTPITPPSLSGARQIRSLALTPDNSKIIAANYTDNSVAVIDPDNPASSTAVPIPSSLVGPNGVADLVATGTGNVFLDVASSSMSGCGGQLLELNLATLKTTQRTDLPFPGLQVGGNSFSRSAGGDQILLGAPGCAAYLWNSASDTFIQDQLVSDSVASSADGYWFSSDFVRLDAQMTTHMQPQIPEFFSPTFAADYPGEKMNASGSLLYTPVPQGIESNAVDITDTNTGAFVGGIQLSEQIGQPSAQTVMDFDETGNRLFLITNKGLTVVQLAAPPLSIGYLNPSTGPASGGTQVTLRGSGFESGATVTVGGGAATASFVDSSTLTVVTPGGNAGGARVTVLNPDGTAYSLDAGFVYQ
jgi:hypothetical protein